MYYPIFYSQLFKADFFGDFILFLFVLIVLVLASILFMSSSACSATPETRASVALFFIVQPPRRLTLAGQLPTVVDTLSLSRSCCRAAQRGNEELSKAHLLSVIETS